MKANYLIAILCVLAIAGDINAQANQATSKLNTLQTKPKPALVAPEVEIRYDNNRKFYYIANAENGKIIKVLSYNKVGNFREGMAIIESDNTVGFINIKGEEIVSLGKGYQWAENFTDGIAVLGTKLSYLERKDAIIINKTGEKIIPVTFQDAKSISENLIPVKQQAKWGFINKTGNTVIPFNFDDANAFHNSLAAVAIKKMINNKNELIWGYINKEGKTVLPFNFYTAEDFHNNYAIVTDTLFKNYLIDNNGNKIISTEMFGSDCKIISLKWIDEKSNLIMISPQKSYVEAKLWGIYDIKNAKFVIKPNFYNLETIVEPVSKNTYYKYSDNNGYGLFKNGNDSVPPQFLILEFNDSLIWAVHNPKVENGKIVSGKYSLFNLDLQPVTKLKYNESYDYIAGFSDGLALVKRNEKYGYINRNGVEVLPLEYDNANSFSCGYAIVEKLNRFGAINTKGVVVIPMEYDGLSDFSENISSYTLNNMSGLIDKSAKKITDTKFEGIGSFVNGLAPAMINIKVGFINTKGEMVIAPVYDYAGSFSNGLASVVINEKVGFIDSKGNLIIPCKYNYADDFNDGYALVVEGEKYFLIDTKGNTVKSY